jgi:hypothetical protein
MDHPLTRQRNRGEKITVLTGHGYSGEPTSPLPGWTKPAWETALNTDAPGINQDFTPH